MERGEDWARNRVLNADIFAAAAIATVLVDNAIPAATEPLAARRKRNFMGWTCGGWPLPRAPLRRQPVAMCIYDGVYPIAQPEFDQDAGHVGLDGLIADVELMGDLGVAVSRRN